MTPLIHAHCLIMSTLITREHTYNQYDQSYTLTNNLHTPRISMRYDYSHHPSLDQEHHPYKLFITKVTVDDYNFKNQDVHILNTISTIKHINSVIKDYLYILFTISLISCFLSIVDVRNLQGRIA